MRALSVHQPWAWLIVHGHKDVENRDWGCSYRGPLLIHAGKTLTRKYHRECQAMLRDRFGIALPALEELPRGGVVGVATLVDVVRESTSPWFEGADGGGEGGGLGWVLRDARPLPFHPCAGALGFFNVPAIEVGLSMLEAGHA